MRNLYSIFSTTLIFLAFQVNSIGQTKAQEKSAAKESTWKAGIGYISNNVYLGRTDSVALPYITPSLGYYHKSGFFLAGSFSYIPISSESRIDQFTLEGGYNYASDKLNVELEVSKDFYSEESFNVNSEIKGRLDTYTSYDFGFVEPSVQLGVSFASAPDIGIGLGLEHSFSGFKDKLEISPAFLVNMGTQNFYNDYYNKRRYSQNRGGKNKGNTTYDITAELLGATKFQLMDYEFSLPLNYSLKRINLNFTPTYAIPVNPSDITTTVKPSNGNSFSKTTTENLKNIFYWSCGLTFKF